MVEFIPGDADGVAGSSRLHRTWAPTSYFRCCLLSVNCFPESSHGRDFRFFGAVEPYDPGRLRTLQARNYRLG